MLRDLKESKPYRYHSERGDKIIRKITRGKVNHITCETTTTAHGQPKPNLISEHFNIQVFFGLILDGL